MKKKAELTIADYIDLLNEKSNELSKYEGFFPDKYLIGKVDESKITIKVNPTNNFEVLIPNYEFTIRENLSFDQEWFRNAAKAQLAMYESALIVIRELSETSKLYIENEGNFIVHNNKVFKSEQVQTQFEMNSLNAFRMLMPFKNYSITDLVSSKKNEIMDSIKIKMNSALKAILDSAERINMFEEAPKFVVVSDIAGQSLKLNIMIDEKKVYSCDIDWVKTSIDEAYIALVGICNVTRVILNTLTFYREIVGLVEPRMFITKLFKKQWLITKAGKEILTCLNIKELIKNVYQFN